MDGYNYDPYNNYRGQQPAQRPPPHDPRYQGYPPTYPSYQHSSSFTGVGVVVPPDNEHQQYPPPQPPYTHPTPYGYSPYPSYSSPQPSFNQPETYPSPYAPSQPYLIPPPPSQLQHLEGMLSNVNISDPNHPIAPPAAMPPQTAQPVVVSDSYNYQAYSQPGSGYASASASFNSASYQHSYSIGGGDDAHSNSGRVLLLHGNLDVWVISASNLPNMDMFSVSFQGIFGGKKSSMTSDSYVTFSVANAVLGRTSVISNSENPTWNQHFYVPVAHQASHIKFMVKDSDFVGAQLMGTVEIPTNILYSGDKVEGSYEILATNGKPCKAGATLKLLIQYISIDKLKDHYQGVESGPGYIGVPGTYFPLRKGGNVTLYQDAHVPDGLLPQVTMENGMPYEHGKCWVDVTSAIANARRFIYITGWSVYYNVQLLRDVPGSEYKLGDLLKSKSREGVRVLLLIWDDPTSTSIIGIKKEGLMQTHDEDTRRFFKNSSVNVILCPRSSGKRHGLIKQKEAGLIYTHHQKTIIFDSDAGNNKRKIVAFVGGLDLCDGRYDNPSHPIFRTLDTLHKDDYHNPTFLVPSTGSPPREPWHDLHTKIDGPAAYDVLQNFEERWKKVSKKTSQDTLLVMERIRDILTIDETSYLNNNDPDTWHVQIFRSIDSNSVKGFPKDSREASSKNLVCGKNILVDMSIHTAYVKAIRSAQRFIYIENQYFLGSSFNWRTHNELGANNLIPIEIALKIVSKIKSRERFSVYIVIPMWPEGNPTDFALQRILLWQNKTMQMMYETIYSALREVGLDNTYTPQDYLNFFCLGNREAPDYNSKPSSTSTPNTPSVRAEKNRRFMIYVHSKGMIVDDEYLIVGSANINQRSLEGSRDTEIAMGAYQPRHTWNAKQSAPNGQIYAYRMSLWAEHTGVVEDCFNKPESLECMQRVRAMGEFNWNLFYSDEVTEMNGHLIKYPVDVEKTGIVKPLQGCLTFPDVGGNICGSSGPLDIPENLTI